MAGNSKSAKPVNDAMVVLQAALDEYNAPSNPELLSDPPPPIDPPPAETVDCVALSAIISDLVQLQLDNCPGA